MRTSVVLRPGDRAPDHGVFVPLDASVVDALATITLTGADPIAEAARHAAQLVLVARAARLRCAADRVPTVPATPPAPADPPSRPAHGGRPGIVRREGRTLESFRDRQRRQALELTPLEPRPHSIEIAGDHATDSIR